MRKTYLAVTEAENEKNIAYVLGIGESENVVAVFRDYKNIIFANIYPTKKRAKEVADFWNDCYKKNGTYKFA